MIKKEKLEVLQRSFLRGMLSRKQFEDSCKILGFEVIGERIETPRTFIFKGLQN